MAILVDGSTKVICQGITGASGAFHTKGCLDYGTQLVGGVNEGARAVAAARGGATFTCSMLIDATAVCISKCIGPLGCSW